MGCSEQTPEERIASLRSHYKASLTGFIVQEEPVEVVAEDMPELEAMEEVESADPAELEAIDEIPEYDVSTTVLLDILMQNNGSERLDGITVDISMIDAAQREKGHWRVWFDTSTIAKANFVARTHTLEDPGYEEGDGFAVEVRRVPAAERSEYREFAAAN
jgi:hypothetical protein